MPPKIVDFCDFRGRQGQGRVTKACVYAWGQGAAFDLADHS